MKKINKKRLIINTLLFVILPIFLNIVIESLGNKALFGGFVKLFSDPFVFFCNALIIALTMAPGLLMGRFRYFWTVVVSFTWLLLGFANFLLLCNRVLPLTVHDMHLLDLLSSMIQKYLNPFFLAVVCFFVVCLMIAVFILFFRAKPPKEPFCIKKSLIFFAALLILTGGSLKIATTTGALDTRFPELPRAYRDNGFVYSFSLSMLDVGVDRVDGYSEKLIDSIVDSLEKTDKNDIKTPNIIFLQLESFFDVNCLKNVEFSENPIPNFTALSQTCGSGLITVPTIGAGTVNTEFEIVTGMRMIDFGAGEYPYKTILKDHPAESIANNLKGHGYSAHFIHNYKATFYGRHLVYSNLGYDFYRAIENMSGYTLTENGWPEDRILTEYITQGLEYTDGPDVITCISVQPHGSYSDVGEYEKHVTVTNCTDSAMKDSYEYYANQVYEVDLFLGELIDTLSQLDEDTILVAYGDHFPSLEFTDSDVEGRTVYQTDYLIWNNMGLSYEDRDMPAYMLNSTVLKSLNIKDGVINACHQTYGDDDKKHSEYLQALEYDMLYGKGYAYDGEFPYKPTRLNTKKLPMRVTDVVASDPDNGVYIVIGSGFTPDTFIRVNHMIVKTEYVNSNILQFTSDDYDPTEPVSVWSMDSGNSKDFIKSESINEKPTE